MRRIASTRFTVAAMLLCAIATGAAQESTTPAAPVPATTGTAAQDIQQAQASDSAAKHSVTSKDRRRAAKLFMEATKLFEKQQFDAAMRDYEEAAKLDPHNANYGVAAQVARSHVVMDLMQQAAKARIAGDAAGERNAVDRAAKLDPHNPDVVAHLAQMSEEVVPARPMSIYEQASQGLESAPQLIPVEGKHSFHQRGDRRQVLQSVYRSYGIEAAVDQSVAGPPVRVDLDDATFAEASRAVLMATDTFLVPLDSHRALVARDTAENRRQYMRQEFETVYLGGMTPAEMTDIGNMAKNVFQVRQVAVEPSAGTMTVRAPSSTIKALNATLEQLLAGRSQVVLDLKLIQLAHGNKRDTGVTPPQQITAFNVYTEEQAILNANQELVQQIISSGLAAPGDTLAILGILLASGQVSSSIFQNGVALFGGGLTLTGLSPGPVKIALNLNSSESRALDSVQLRMGDGEEGTLKSGLRYPIMTSNYSNLGTGGLNIPGLTTAGSSSGLSSLLSSLTASTQASIPQVEYQDLGLTFKATPRVIRSGEVALSMDMKITALGAQQLNGVPVLNNRSYSGVATLKDGEGVVIVSQVDKEESRALSGWPGLTEIPGLNNVTDKQTQHNYATMVMVITAHVVRGTQTPGATKMMRVERGTNVQ